MTVTDEQLTSFGFIKEFKSVLGKVEPTGVYRLPGFSPEPYVDTTYERMSYGRYKGKNGIQVQIKHVQDLEKFVSKHIPTYSEPIN